MMDQSEIAATVREFEAAQARGEYFPKAWFDRLTLDDAYRIRQLCPAVVPVQANHRLYTEYHERILKAVDTCLPVEKVCSIDEMACKLMGTERQVPVARQLAVKVKRALREQVGECLTCSIGLAPNVFLGKVGSDLKKPDGLG
jgi:DNA polymerase-4